jgi:hypothetical protein
MKFLNDWRIVILACLTLGLAPFSPEPHIWGKLKWLIGGAKGMQLMDWFDLLMHGMPFIFLIRMVFLNLTKKNISK